MLQLTTCFNLSLQRYTYNNKHTRLVSLARHCVTFTLQIQQGMENPRDLFHKHRLPTYVCTSARDIFSWRKLRAILYMRNTCLPKQFDFQRVISTETRPIRKQFPVTYSLHFLGSDVTQVTRLWFVIYKIYLLRSLEMWPHFSRFTLLKGVEDALKLTFVLSVCLADWVHRFVLIILKCYSVVAACRFTSTTDRGDMNIFRSFSKLTCI